VRKIISILLALGVVLGLMVTATPVAAAITGVSVSVAPRCVCQPAVYNVTFNISASLTQGVGCVCIEFPAGTTIPATGSAWENGDILINSVKVFGAEVTVTGMKVCFIPPVDLEPATNNSIKVEFTSKAGIKNTCTPGKYTLKVSTCRAPDSTPVESPKFEIIPCVSTYKIAWDSSAMYTGIASDFVPPFKACGQNVSYGSVPAVETSPGSGKWMNGFNITLKPDVLGCLTPCVTNVSVYFELTGAPQPVVAGGPLSQVTLNFTGGPNLLWTGGVLTYDATKSAALQVPGETEFSSIGVTENTTATWSGLVHFDTVGDYTLHVWVECPAGAGGICVAGTSESIIADRVFTFKVYQWKDVGKIVLKEKWNLVSLPLVPFDTSITGLLASLPAAAKNSDGVNDLVSIWNYSGGAWSSYPGTLATMVDGKSYWVRMTYPWSPAGGNYTWWIFGTARNMPPLAPSAYSVVPGWNMFGFTSLANMDLDAYLWNFDGTPPKPLVYGWKNTGSWLDSTWEMHPFDNADIDLLSGQGFWGAFTAAGTIIP